ncbi:MAG: hypothetical protein AAF799_42770 [Myxococcota bacterium]
MALIYKVIGILSIVGGILLVVLGWAGGFIFAWQGEFKGGFGFGTLLTIIGVIVAVGGLPELLLASGLRARKPWARWLGIMFSVMGLPVFPIGTILGAYGLRILMSDACLREFRVERSWLADGSAIALGWMYRDGNRRRKRGGSALSQFFAFASLLVLLACLLVGLAMVSMVIRFATGDYDRPSPKADVESSRERPRARRVGPATDRPGAGAQPIVGDPPYNPAYQPSLPAVPPPAPHGAEPPRPAPPPAVAIPAEPAPAVETEADPVSEIEVVAIAGAKGARDRIATLRLVDGTTKNVHMGDRIRSLDARVVGINPTSVLLQVKQGREAPRVVRLEFERGRAKAR